MPSPRRPSAVTMKRESSVESSVSQPRIAKKLKTQQEHEHPASALATVHLFIPVPDTDSHKLALDPVPPSASQPKRKRNGHFKMANATPESSDGGASSGDDADDEVDSHYRGSDGEGTDVDDEERAHVESSIVVNVPTSPTSSLPATPTFPRTFRFSTSSTTRAPESPLIQVEDMLSTIRSGNRWISSSSDGSCTEREISSPRRKRNKTAIVTGNASSVEDLVTEQDQPMADVDAGRNTPSHVGQRILFATVSAVTAGLQALVSRRFSPPKFTKLTFPRRLPCER